MQAVRLPTLLISLELPANRFEAILFSVGFSASRYLCMREVEHATNPKTSTLTPREPIA